MGFLNKTVQQKTIKTDVSFEYSCPEGKEQESQEAFDIIAASLSFKELTVLREICKKPGVKTMAMNIAGSYI
jgi:hypothetical protein